MSNPTPWKRAAGAAGLVAAGLVAGGILAGTISASAADTATGSADSSTSESVDPSQPQRSDEELLTGATLAAVEKAVLAEYPGATIERTETDSDGVYESHIVTADGEDVIVQVDESFAVTGTQTGGGGGHHDRDGDGAEGEGDTGGA